MKDADIKNVLEAALFAAGSPLSLDKLKGLFPDSEAPSTEILRRCIQELITSFDGRGIELVEVASGYRIQTRAAYAPWVSRLWEERPPKYSRALLETLALIAYRQPVTRGEIEDVRGVAVSSNIVRTLLERQWVRVVGHRDVPGRPALYGTTRVFLDYFNLSSLNELPPLAQLRDIDNLNQELDLVIPAQTELPVDGPGSSVNTEPATAERATAEDEQDESKTDTPGATSGTGADQATR